MKVTHPVWAVLITCVAMFTQILLGAGPAMLLLDSGDALYRPLGMIGITLASLGLVHVIRRLGRQTWHGVGLTRSWRAVPHLLLGVLAGGAAVAAAGVLAVTVGAATWVSSERAGADLSFLPLSIAFALLSQAFPEELLWRGHLYDTLSARMSPKAVLIVVSVGFGLLHIVSQSAADTVAERLLYVLQAVGLGFACAAARWRTGAVWMAVGVHTGLHVGHLVVPVLPVHFGVHVVILACTLTVTALLIMAGRRPTITGAGSGQTLPSPSHGR
ncbi:lysostaphin resistance A-like protein [Nonomuraea sp. KM88]|uniref:lysostaphin resistance A-like protein n=1 Tax=Nonomuraea sp. KM88 TaxID=3457427 RepID=UPI003FCC5B79